jgi:hypothetical protein
MIWVAGRSPTLVSQNLKATTLTYLAILVEYCTEKNPQEASIYCFRTYTAGPFSIAMNE